MATMPVTTNPSPSHIITKHHGPVLFDPNTLPQRNIVHNVPRGILQPSTVPSDLSDPSVPVILYSFPFFAPLQLLNYPATHLYLPLRRDLLHRAITFEGDAAHQWTRWTPHRKDHRGSGRKLMPQKGQGRARVGDSSSPIRVRGIKPFGPKPRDMSTKLPRKIYDRAWRTALSWKYRRGDLVVVDKIFHGEMARLDKINVARFVETFNGHDGGSAATLWTDDEHKSKTPIRTTWVLADGGKRRDHFEQSMAVWWPKDKVRTTDMLDVKNLLEGQRIVIERAALNDILRKRQADLPRRIDWQKRQLQLDAHEQSMRAAADQTRRLQQQQQMAALESLKLLRSDQVSNV